MKNDSLWIPATAAAALTTCQITFSVMPVLSENSVEGPFLGGFPHDDEFGLESGHTKGPQALPAQLIDPGLAGCGKTS